MFLRLEAGEVFETRSRPSRRPRWRHYVPPAALAIAGLAVLVAPSVALGTMAGLRLSGVAATAALALLLVGLSSALAAIVHRRSLTTALIGTLAVTLGANLAPSWGLEPWTLGVPLSAAGLGWLLLLEVARLTNGLALTNRRLVLPRPLRRPLALRYGDVRAVHVTSAPGRPGSLILETEHGTLAAPDLGAATDLGERIEARMASSPPELSLDSLAVSRARIEEILAGVPTRPDPRAMGSHPAGETP